MYLWPELWSLWEPPWAHRSVSSCPRITHIRFLRTWSCSYRTLRDGFCCKRMLWSCEDLLVALGNFQLGFSEHVFGISPASLLCCCCWMHVTALEVEMALTLPPRFACNDWICRKPFWQNCRGDALYGRTKSHRTSPFLSPCAQGRDAP